MFEPIADKIIVKATDTNDTTEGGVILPDIAQEDTMQAEVIAVGPGGKSLLTGERIPMTIEKGDIVLFPQVHSKVLEFQGEEYYCIKEVEILSIIKGDISWQKN